MTHSNHLNTAAAITSDATSLNIASPSVSRPLFHAKKPSIATVNVKIVKAKMKRNLSGKAEFTFIAQIFVGVTDATAHVDYITSEVNKIWGQGHDLVTNDGLPIVDCSGTQGIYFLFTNNVMLILLLYNFHSLRQ